MNSSQQSVYFSDNELSIISAATGKSLEELQDFLQESPLYQDLFKLYLSDTRYEVSLSF